MFKNIVFKLKLILVMAILSFLVTCQEDKIEEDFPIINPEITDNNNTLSEIKLEATGSGSTYELINSVLAPGYNVVEVPDCNHESFGRHIDEIFDHKLEKYVFRFLIHTTPDNDRCIKFDRQRNEIKTYDKSPDNLKGIQNEKVVYSWKFKIDTNFKSSKKFTHLHQIKAVGGTEDSMPLFTLTTRKGSPDKLELRYSESVSQVTLKKVELASLKGIWLQVKETIIFGEKEVGTYDIAIENALTNELLFSYENNNIRTWKTNAEFMRPKWGIYRSLLDETSLRDEEVLFADFNIKELKN